MIYKRKKSLSKKITDIIMEATLDSIVYKDVVADAIIEEVLASKEFEEAAIHCCIERGWSRPE